MSRQDGSSAACVAHRPFGVSGGIERMGRGNQPKCREPADGLGMGGVVRVGRVSGIRIFGLRVSMGALQTASWVILSLTTALCAWGLVLSVREADARSAWVFAAAFVVNSLLFALLWTAE